MKADFKKCLEDKNLGQTILDRLSEMQALPNTGVVAGAAVASAIFELLDNGVKPVYNDIDIFHFTDINEMRKMEKDGNAIFNIKSNTKYDGIFKNGSSVGSRILGANRDEFLNNVYVATNQDHTAKDPDVVKKRCIDLLNAFDFNYVQCGVDLETKLVYTTDEFVKFLKSKQLEIVNFKTLPQSIIRWYKKVEELGDTVYSDENSMVKLMQVALTAAKINQVRDGGQVALTFKEEVLNRYKAVKDKIDPNFTCFQNRVKYGEENNWSLEVAEPKGISVIHEIYTLGNRYNNLKMIYTPIQSVIDLYIFDKMAKAVHKTELAKVFALADKIDEVEANRNNQHHDHRGPLSEMMRKYLSQFLNQRTMNEGSALKVFNFMKGHRLATLFQNHSFDRVKEIIQEIKNYQSTLSKDKSYAIIGFLENDSNQLLRFDIELFKKNCEKEFMKRNKELIKPLEVVKNTSDVKIRELTTITELEAEGVKMRHCVGGYSNLVRTEKARIFSVLVAGGQKKHVTVEMRKAINEEGEEVYSLVQMKHRFNVMVEPETRDAILHAIIERYGLAYTEDFRKDSSECQYVV